MTLKASPLQRKTPLSRSPIKRKTTRKCKVCRQEFAPWRPGVPTCGEESCMHAYALSVAEKSAAKRAKEAAKAEREKTKARKEKIKKRSEWAADAQKEFNAWIRARDFAAGYGCISCGTKADVQYAAGHYRTVAAAPHLRYSEDNVHLQCNKNCNSAKAGNVVEYRINLVKRIGLARVEALENDNTPKKYSIDELRAIRDEYRAKLRELLREKA